MIQPTINNGNKSQKYLSKFTPVRDGDHYQYLYYKNIIRLFTQTNNEYKMMQEMNWCCQLFDRNSDAQLKMTTNLKYRGQNYSKPAFYPSQLVRKASGKYRGVEWSYEYAGNVLAEPVTTNQFKYRGVAYNIGDTVADQPTNDLVNLVFAVE